MSHIFISYSHKDKSYAQKLAKALQENGFIEWIDGLIDYGSEWSREIQGKLDSCAAFIVIMTSNSYSSHWVQSELNRAMRKGKKIFPLLLEGDVWLSVEAIQYIDVTNGRLPSNDFYDVLAGFAPRRIPEKGQFDLSRQELIKSAQSTLFIQLQPNEAINQLDGIYLELLFIMSRDIKVLILVGGDLHASAENQSNNLTETISMLQQDLKRLGIEKNLSVMTVPYIIASSIYMTERKGLAFLASYSEDKFEAPMITFDKENYSLFDYFLKEFEYLWSFGKERNGKK